MYSDKTKLPRWVQMAEDMKDFYLPTLVFDNDFPHDGITEESKIDHRQDKKWNSHMKYLIVLICVFAVAFLSAMAILPYLANHLSSTAKTSSYTDYKKGKSSTTLTTINTTGYPITFTTIQTPVKAGLTTTNVVLKEAMPTVSTAFTTVKITTAKRENTTSPMTTVRIVKPEMPTTESEDTTTTARYKSTTTKQTNVTISTQHVTTTRTKPVTRLTNTITSSIMTTPPNVLQALFTTTIRTVPTTELTMMPITNSTTASKELCTEKPVGERDCLALMMKGCQRSGQYFISPAPNVTPVSVLCDMTSFGGGWTVFQRRYNGELSFLRNWTEYENGFGSVNKEYWLGNELLHSLTRDKSELLIVVSNFKRVKKFARYPYFRIGNKSEDYQLEVKGYTGTAGNSIDVNGKSNVNGMKFSAPGKDNDNSRGDCAMYYKSGWWFNNCHKSLLNGKYCGPGKLGYECNIWYTFEGKEGMKTSMMLTRRT